MKLTISDCSTIINCHCLLALFCWWRDGDKTATLSHVTILAGQEGYADTNCKVNKEINSLKLWHFPFPSSTNSWPHIVTSRRDRREVRPWKYNLIFVTLVPHFCLSVPINWTDTVSPFHIALSITEGWQKHHSTQVGQILEQSIFLSCFFSNCFSLEVHSITH